LASFNTVRLLGAGEADIAGIEVRIGVAGAGGISRTDWAGVEGMKSLMGRKGEGEVLRVDIGMGVGEDKLLGSLSGRDFAYNKRLFRCGGNSIFRRLVPFLLLLLLLFSNCKEGEVY
jgi:hypothetical protein